jgi:phosphoribosylformylglycinamidine cyclo-ligase
MGLTSARHDALHKIYGIDYPESFDTGPQRAGSVYWSEQNERFCIYSGFASTDIGHLL